MAITATFLADFSDFERAVASASTKLSSFTLDASKVENALKRMADSFTGKKILSDAVLATKAITDLGEGAGVVAGALKLTTAEQTRLNAQLTEAIAKYAALGKDAPADMLALAKATEQTGKAMKEVPQQMSLMGKASAVINSEIGKMAAGFAIGNVIGKATDALASFALQAFKSADEVVGLSDKLGLSIRQIQEMQYVAGKTNSTLDGFAMAATQLQQRIGGGSNSVASAVDALGLSFDSLRNKGTEDQFNAIVASLGNIKDAAERNRLGMIIFGKSFDQIATAVAQGYRGLADGANVMADEHQRALADAKSAWDDFLSGTIYYVGVALGEAVRQVQGDMTKLGRIIGLIKPPKLGPGEDLMTVPDTRPLENYTKRMEDAQRVVNKLSLEQLRQLDAAQKLDKEGYRRLVDSLGLTEDQVGLVAGRLSEMTSAITEQGAAMKQSLAEVTAYHQKLNAINDSMRGMDDITRAFDLVEAMGLDKVIDLTGLSEEKLALLHKAMNEAIDAANRIGMTIPDVWYDVAAATQAAVVQLQYYIDQMGLAAKKFDDLEPMWNLGAKTGGQMAGPGYKGPSITDNKASSLVSKGVGSLLFGGMGDTLKTQLGPTLISAFAGGGNAGQAVGGLFGGQLLKGLGGAVTKKIGGVVGGALGSVIPGIGTLIGGLAGSALGAGLGKVFGGLFGGGEANKVKKERDKWLQESFGGAEAFKTMAKQAGLADAEIAKLFSAKKMETFTKLAEGAVKKIEDFEKATEEAAKAQEEMNEFVEDLGGWDSFLKLAYQAGIAEDEISKMFSTKTPKDFEKAATDAMKKIDLFKARETIFDKFGGEATFRKLVEQAGIAKDQLDILFNTTNIRAFEDAAKDVNKELDRFTEERDADAKRVQEAIDKYGLSLEQLGGKLQQSELDKRAKELIEDWRVLADAGVDVATINAAMGKEINDYLADARNLGVEVPAAMRPILESMMRQGTLTDGLGNKVTGMEQIGVKYSQTTTEGFERIIEKLDETLLRLGLIERSMLALPTDHTMTVHVEYEVGTPPPGVPSPEPVPVPPDMDVVGSYQQGTRGRFLNFGKQGSLVMLHGRERVMTESEAEAAPTPDMTAMVASIASLQVTMVRAIRENALHVRDQSLIALGRA